MPGYYLYGNECLSECPATYLSDELSICYKASEPTLPFVTLIGTILIMILVIISKICHRDTKPFRAFLALESAYLQLFWIYWVVFLYKDGHK